MKILGIGGSNHDFSCCILDRGNILCAIEEERLSREKHGDGKRSKLLSCIRYCLLYCNLELDDIDIICANDLLKHLNIEKIVNRDILYINHHLSHAAAVYFSSGYTESAIFCIDGIGSLITENGRETMSSYKGIDNKITMLQKAVSDLKVYPTQSDKLNYVTNNDSLGWIYEYVTVLCGFGKFDQGKLMGLAPYGSNQFVHEFEKYIYHNGFQQTIKTKELIDAICEWLHGKEDDELFQLQADIAYAMQYTLEKEIITHLNSLHSVTKCDYLCIGGGVAMNSSLNGKILSNTPFKHLFIYPASGDSGTAVGAALYAYYCILPNQYHSRNSLQHIYLGKEYKTEDILKAASDYNNIIKIHEMDEESLLLHAATYLDQGKIIAWFQGGSELGPRALGHRSILANPSIPDMKDIINKRIKGREAFRPFAPSAMEEFAADYFEINNNDFKFMIVICKVKKDKRSVIPSVTHVDGTARLQTVTEKNNSIYYKLIKAFYQKSGIPLLLNTSFNINGEPIVETPKDAIKTLVNSNLDALYIHNYLIQKNL